ncbi:tetratricopeptide repeat protein [Citromicrobium bathyomarinum]|uniref:tetratricopeptide repeat protein n=1 Tax=Citromicrobium bathyomarinum TaxID=72174 RepID=UPI001E3D8E1A|nr:hypothetical protein [Citromicrobium bathyomarinum]MCD1623899.1 hypothetical protein [Citromicrobium bathyomarinum]
MLKFSVASALAASLLASSASAQSQQNVTYSANATEAPQRNLVQPIRPGDSTQPRGAQDSALSDALRLLAKRDYSAAYEGLITLAQQGDGRAMREIGWMYANGRGLTADPAAALGWFQEAAIAGDERAMLILGTALARGLNIEKQPEAARYWLQRARASDERRIAGSAADELRKL